MLTGARLAEVTGMQRAELSEGGRVWIIPGERAKNHRPNLLPLPAHVQAILAALPRIEGPFVFTNTGKVLTGLSWAKAQLDAAMLAVERIPPRLSRRGEFTICGDPARPACTRSELRHTSWRRCSIT